VESAAIQVLFPFEPGPKGPADLKGQVGLSTKVVLRIVQSPLDDSVEDGEKVSVGVAMLGLERSVSEPLVVVVVAAV
jgi:hypothetical protein